MEQATRLHSEKFHNVAWQPAPFAPLGKASRLHSKKLECNVAACCSHFYGFLGIQPGGLPHRDEYTCAFLERAGTTYSLSNQIGPGWRGLGEPSLPPPSWLGKATLVLTWGKRVPSFICPRWPSQCQELGMQFLAIVTQITGLLSYWSTRKAKFYYVKLARWGAMHLDFSVHTTVRRIYLSQQL